MSDFDTDKKGGKTISQLETYSGDSDILNALLRENDNLDLLTFDIGNTNGENGDGKYNGDKIKVEEDPGSLSQLSNGFKRYKHTPDGGGAGKYGCVIYNRNVLMGKDGNAIGQIQNKQYTAVYAYFGDKEKRTNGGTRDSEVPLLIELTKSGDPDYYVHKKGPGNGTNGVKYYWENLSGDNNGTLKNLLEDIGLNTKSGERGHATLKSLLGQASLKNGEGDLSLKLQQAKGSKLKNLLDQKVNGQKSLLLLLLARVEFNLVDSVVILVERKDGGNYGEGEIYGEIGNLEPEREINRIKNEGVEISLNDKTNQNFNCVKDSNYKVMEHDFSKYVEKLNPPGQQLAGLRFLIPASNSSDKYKELSLYDSTGPENLVYKYYGGPSGSDKVYVVFYGDKDPRPLLACYNNEAYIPNSKEKYDTEWVKASGVSKCLCEGTGDDPQNEPLLDALIRVVGFLNTVDLSKHPNGTDGNGGCTNSGSPSEGNTCTTATENNNANTCTYVVHTYKGQKVQVKVTCEPVTTTSPGTSCYKKLTHEPAGMNGENGDRFRLGDVTYPNGSGSPQGSIKYYENGGDNPNKYKPLVKVEAYFYDQDTNYNDPLLVVLEFKNGAGTNVCEYYKLKTRNEHTMTWQKDTENAKSKVEENGNQLVEYLDQIRYDLKKVLKVKLECKGGTKYPAMWRASSASNGVFSPLNGGTKKIEVKECKDGTCPQLTSAGYKCYQHKISTIDNGFDYNEIGGLAFYIPNKDKESEVELELHNGEPSRSKIERLFYNKCMGDVFVYFYGEDPRPLLLCFNKKVYRAQTKDDYFEMWVQDSTIQKCVCSELGEGQNEALLKSLTKVVGFLNEVNLYKYPGNCNGSGVASATTCTGTGSTCTYVVHKYQGKEVQIKVVCQKINMDGSTSTGSECHYKRMIHTHNGIANGAGGAEGFRLGSVKYEGTNQGQVRYTTSTYKWYPLIRVTAYYYDQDKEYKDPLLVELVFKNGKGAVNGKVSEYYKLTERDSSMNWTKDDSAESKLKDDADNKKLIEYLEKVRYYLKKVIQIEIQNYSGSYQLKGRTGRDTRGQFAALQNGGSKEVKVQVCETDNCSKLKEKNYNCFQHKITDIENQNDIGGLKFTVPGETGNGDIEIPLYDEGGTKIPQIQYNRCMGDVFVYFYNGSRTGVQLAQVDFVPLMLYFNGKWYMPENRDKYFEKWVQVKGLDGVPIPCGNGHDTNLVNKLNEVNRALNQIDLDQSSRVSTASTGDGYGLPEEVESSGTRPHPSHFPTDRVKLIKQPGPSQPPPPPPQPAYYRVVHRTVNGFQIGEITYEKKEIVKDGITPKGTGTKIDVKKNGPNGNKDHTSLVSEKKWNTVVAYYSKDDENFQLPQLIVILKTDGPIVGTGKVTGSSGTGYGYYILTNKNGRSGAGVGASSGVTNGHAKGSGVSVNYEYVWRLVENNQVTLNDATDFLLLNSVVILLDKKCNGTSYKEEQIKEAIKTANLNSPGQTDDINRITGKTINVTDGTKDTCLKEAKFKVISHNISELVTPSEPLKKALPNVSLIAGLRFLIPTRDSKDKYLQLRLFYSSIKVILYHHNSQNKVYVFFYGSDPRPLLLCYNSFAYSAKGMRSYFYWWVKDKTINKCECKESSCECKRTGDDCCKLLESLVRVSNFLNRVDISNVPSSNLSLCYYQVQRFNGQDIKIRVEFTPANKTFCYKKYAHTHVGTGYCKSDGKGFRLGTIDYGYRCIKENNSKSASNGDKCITSELKNGEQSNNHKSADQVVVFYYQGDTKLERPLLVALCKNDNPNQCTVYYELQNDEGKGSTVKKYKKGENSIDLSDTLGGDLERKLDSIRYNISITLQIIIDKRTIERLYCLKKNEKNGQPDDCKKNNNI